MNAFVPLFKLNVKRRICDGFALGYNIIFPMVLIGLLGFLTRKMSFGGITGFEYYSLVTVPFTILMALVTAAYAGKDDAYAKTADRILSAPVTITDLVFSKVLSETLVFFFCAVFVSFLCEIFWNVGIVYGGAGIYILFLTLSFATATCGTFIGFGMKNFLAVKNFISLPICMVAVIGGCFYRIPNLGKELSVLKALSPCMWINRSIFMVLYDKNSGSIWRVSLIAAIIGLIFLVLAIVQFKKEEYGNGELPGYDK